MMMRRAFRRQLLVSLICPNPITPLIWIPALHLLTVRRRRSRSLPPGGTIYPKKSAAERHMIWEKPVYRLGRAIARVERSNVLFGVWRQV